jgi:prophage regulatory protein
MRKRKLIAPADTKLQKRKLLEAPRSARPTTSMINAVESSASVAEASVVFDQRARLPTSGVMPSPRSGLASIAMLNVRRTVRRAQLREIVPLADTTIYEMELRGEFPRRFYLTPRCVVWDLSEVEAWVVARREASDTTTITRAPTPDVRRRRTRPVKR